MMENLIQSQMNGNFHQDIFKAIDKIRNKQQANVEPILIKSLKLLEMKAFQKHSSRRE